MLLGQVFFAFHGQVPWKIAIFLQLSKKTDVIEHVHAGPTVTGSTQQKSWCLMIRSELIQKISEENPHLFQRDVERIVNTVFEEVIDAMSRGDRVELRGFGAFSVKKRDARTGRNPRTGDSVDVEEKHVPFFKTGKLLRDRLNGVAE